MPDCSVVQGSKLSTTLYTIYTLDTTKISRIMTDNDRYKEIVNKDVTNTNNPEHKSVGYIDDITHVTGLFDKEEQELYLNNLYSLLEKHYNNKRLQINGSKTQFLTIPRTNKDDYKIKLRINHNTMVSESEKIKILGFIQNKRNNMESHLNSMASKVGMTLAKLKPMLTYMPEEIKKRVISAKVKSLALYGCQLFIGQPQHILQRACAILMWINRKMFNNT